jgi:phospholipid/cholesterol/gamma-HCH transport system substrate-binding protein
MITNPLRTAERTLERLTDEATHAADLAQRRPPVLAGLGVALIALVGGIVTLILMSFGGAFSSDVSVTADLPAAGSAVSLNSAVEYRDVTVGKVATSAKTAPNGLVTVVLHINPSKLGDIPADVTATIAPISVFGNQYVVLIPPRQLSGQTLKAGQTIPAVTQGTTSNLQTTLADLDYLLKEVHPAQLYSALYALSYSLQGQGQHLGHTFVQFNSYLHNMLPLWPKSVTDFKLLAPVANQVAASTPDILTTIRNFSSSSGVITQGQAALEQLLAGGTTFANLTADLLTNIQQPYAQLTSASGPFLNSLSQTPTTISQILTGLDGWAKTWVAAEAQGPYLTLSASVSVHNVADLAYAALGAPNVAGLLGQALGTNLINPPTYTAADCPRYGTLAGSNCPGFTAAATTALHSMSQVSILPEPQQQEAVARVAAGLNGNVPPSSPSVATLMLEPILTSVAARP